MATEGGQGDSDATWVFMKMFMQIGPGPGLRAGSWVCGKPGWLEDGLLTRKTQNENTDKQCRRPVSGFGSQLLGSLLL